MGVLQLFKLTTNAILKYLIFDKDGDKSLHRGEIYFRPDYSAITLPVNLKGHFVSLL